MDETTTDPSPRAMLENGDVEEFNAWREANPGPVDLSNLRLVDGELRDCNLSQADLRNAELERTDFAKSDLRGAIFHGAAARHASFRLADLSGSYLQTADFYRADFGRASLAGALAEETDFHLIEAIGADFTGMAARGACFQGAALTPATLDGADLRGCNLTMANLGSASLRGADLTGADLLGAFIVEADLENAILDGCNVYAASVWDANLTGVSQSGLIVSKWDQPVVTVDDLAVAQFVHLMMGNRDIRRVIDTLTSKVVLILGRFTPERKRVLDALRSELRTRDYVPVIFDFDIPADRDVTETVTLLARMARFIVADLTEPSSIPQELQAIVPDLAVPVQPLITEAQDPYAMFRDLKKYHWLLKPHRYAEVDDLLVAVAEAVIQPCERKATELAEQKRDAWA